MLWRCYSHIDGRVSAGSMRADSGVNEAPVGLQSRIVTEPAGEKRLQTKQHPLRVLFCLVVLLPQSKRRVSVGSMRADSVVNEAPVGLQSRIVTEPAGEKRLQNKSTPKRVLLFWRWYSLNRSSASASVR